MMKNDLEVLQEKIGYHFKDVSYLCNALTHSSYAYEKSKENVKDNERLEFLGDSVLELVSSDFIYKNHPDYSEGNMTKLRASIVCEPTLAFCARAFELGSFLFLGHGEEITGGRERDSIVSDACEAVIGAIYLDGGLNEAIKFIETFILNDIEHKKLFYDAKTSLQEIVQNTYKQTLHYELISEEGPDHNKSFTVCAFRDDIKMCTGKGRTKKAAEQDAAYNSLVFMNKK